MDGLAAVQARIAAIETRFSLRPPPATPTSNGPGATSFESVLATAMSTTTAPGPATVDGPLRPPAELAPYGNGRIPLDAMASIGGGHRLYAPAARQYDQMVAAAAADGVPIGITDSYRDLDAQVRVAVEKGLYSQGGLAAAPGTSPHGWGLAVDLDLDADAQAWMRANGPRFGFVEDTPREPWHWTFRAH